MAYTYDDFVSAANSAGMMGEFSEYDLQTARNDPEYGLSILRLKQDAANASTEEQRLLANEAANQLRSAYGAGNAGNTGEYSNQIDGLIGRIDSYGSFNYQNEDAYQKLLDGVVNRQPFSYDLDSDPSWSAYRKAYLREGERASANAMAQASAASGGRPSSYAITAAQQAGNYYAGQLADMIPTLEQNAYSRYLDDLNTQMNSLGALQTDRNAGYQEWMDQYEMLQNSLGNYQAQAATEYQKYLDAYEQQYRAQQSAVTQRQQEHSNALALLQTMGYATPDVARILGIPAGTTFAGTGNGDSLGTGNSSNGSAFKDESDTSTEKDSTPSGKAASVATYAAYRAKKAAAAAIGKTYTTPTAQAFIDRFAGYEDMGYSDAQIKARIENALQNSAGTFGLTDEDFWIINDRFGLGFEDRMK